MKVDNFVAKLRAYPTKPQKEKRNSKNKAYLIADEKTQKKEKIMSNLKIIYMHIQNFKGCESLEIRPDGKDIQICGKNATGKTTVADAMSWLLFNTDSTGQADFKIRPLNKDGSNVDYVEIMVEAELSDGNSLITIQKIQKQKWTRKRGEEEAELTGNTNLYFFNGVPVKEAEYKAAIAGIISEEDFKLLSNPNYFPSLPALANKGKNKRTKLLELCGDVTDSDVIASNERFSVIGSDIACLGLEKSLEKYKGEKKRLVERQKEIPVRIDELSASLTETEDSAPLEQSITEKEARKTALLAQISQIKAEGNTEYLEQKNTTETLEKQLEEAITAVRVNNSKKTANAQGEYEEVKAKYADANFRLSKASGEAGLMQKHLEVIKGELTRAGDEYNKAKDSKLDNSAKTCPYCGQELPQDKLSEVMARHDAERKSIMDKALKVGQEQKKKYKELQALHENKLREVEATKKEISDLKEEVKLKKEAYDSSLEGLENPEDSPEVKELRALVQGVSKKMEEDLNSGKEKIKALESETSGIESEIRSLEKELARNKAISDSNNEKKARIESLNMEMREIGQQVAMTDKKLILLEAFSVAKAKMLSEKINSYFEKAQFKLFQEQVNGGLKETCEIMYEGVPYGSLNTGHRITVALDIIKAFQKLHNMYVPIWLDNAESLSSDNQPNMDCQMIYLKVTDDDTLKVVPCEP